SLEGAEFLPYAREILAQEDAALAAMGHGRAEITGTLRFAASSTFAQLYVAPALPGFLRQHPGLNLDLKLTDNQLDLIEGGFDLALRNYALPDSSLRGRKLAEDRRILCAAPDYLAARGIPERLEDLASHDLLVFGSATPRRLKPLKAQDPEGSFPPAGQKPRVVCDDGSSLGAATRTGLGISMGSRWALHQDLTSGALVQVLSDYEIDDQSAIWLVYPKSNVLTAKVRVFIDFLRQTIGDPPIWEQDHRPG
ncbi:MAG: substrate binding domain-containing protein, partial [Rhodospirillaceae bacterium]